MSSDTIKGVGKSIYIFSTGKHGQILLFKVLFFILLMFQVCLSTMSTWSYCFLWISSYDLRKTFEKREENKFQTMGVCDHCFLVKVIPKQVKERIDQIINNNNKCSLRRKSHTPIYSFLCFTLKEALIFLYISQHPAHFRAGVLTFSLWTLGILILSSVNNQQKK